MSELPTLQQITDVLQICKAALAWHEQNEFLLHVTRDLETANAQLLRGIVDGERQIVALKRELADVTRERDRLRAVMRRTRSGQRRQRRNGARA